MQYKISEHEGRPAAPPAHYPEPAQRPGSAYRRFWRPSTAISSDLQQAALTLTRAAHDFAATAAFDFAGTNVVMKNRTAPARCLRDIFAGLKHAAFTPGIHARISQGAPGARRAGGAASIASRREPAALLPAMRYVSL